MMYLGCMPLGHRIAPSFSCKNHELLDNSSIPHGGIQVYMYAFVYINTYIVPDED